MQPKLSAQQRIELIKRALEGESVSSICTKSQISRTIFYRWLTRYRKYGENGLGFKIGGRPRKSQTPKKIVFRKLSSIERFRMVEAALAKEKDISSLAKEYEVSRNTIYKWIKRYQRAPDKRIASVSDQIPLVKRYFRQAPELYEEAVKSIVSRYPQYGIRKIVQNLPKVGAHSILSHHGVQNILRRNDLSTYEKRFLFAQGQITPQIKTIAAVLGRARQFFALPHDTRKKVIRILTAFSLSFGATIFLTGFFGYVVTTAEKAGIGSAGLFFATVALLMGSIFFLYSLKYYLTLAVVLSFSQEGSGEGEIGIETKGKSLISWLLGLGGRKVNDKKQANLAKAGGLEANLEHVRLTRHPFVSIHIPLYNEKNVVNRVLKASTSFEYEGEYEVIICDDSTDETTQTILDYLKTQNSKLPPCRQAGKTQNGEGWTLNSAEVSPGVTLKHLHRTSRSGFKGGALREALIHTDPRAEFVSVFDADFVPYPDTLTLFLKYFQATAGSLDFAKSKQSSVNSKPNKTANDELQITDYGQRIAAVQGYQWHVLNKSENWITRGVRSEYAGSYVIERSGTEIYSGLKQISGSVYMIRKDVLSEVGWGDSITEDFELTLRLYAQGYKVIYTPYIQAPAECVSTIKRLIRQRMRWAEGHSHNVRKMFTRLIFGHWEGEEVTSDSWPVTSERQVTNHQSQITNHKKKFIPSPLSLSEKLEFLYLSPYYLQAFFFLIGTLSWLISETVFRAHLPFWTELWGWSLVLTNLLALPLMNAVGLFLEESEEKDYAGLASFVALSYILVPFQAYASLKGFLERTEGPWFRTPKTGRITDIFTRGRFYRFIAGILPGRQQPAPAQLANSFRFTNYESRMTNNYLSLSTANSRFDNFRIGWRGPRYLGNIMLLVISVLGSLLFWSGSKIQQGSVADLPIYTQVERTVIPKPLLSYFDFIFGPKTVFSSETLASVMEDPSERTLFAGGLIMIFASLALYTLFYIWGERQKRNLLMKGIRVGLVFLLITVFSFSNILTFLRVPSPINDIVKPPETARAIYQFTPTSGTLVTGSDTTITSATAAAAAGVNIGSWRGTLTDDNFHWSVLGANVVGTNYDVQLNFASVQLNGANKMIIQTEVDLDAAIALIVQICDWTSTTSVDNAADAQCTGGGWRTINSQNASNANVNLTTVTTPAGLQWHIFDGYFTTGTTGGSAVSTPLTNFVSGSNTVKIRYFSTTQSATAIDIDFLRIMPIIDSVYHPASFTNLGSGTPAGTYANAHVVGNTTTAQQATTTGDTVYLQVPGTAGSVPDFYLSFNNVETYTGANTIYFKSEYGCSAATAGLDHKFAVYNFTTPGWEDFSTTAVACSTTQATNAWAKNNVTLSNYISSGEMRVRFYGDLNSTTSLRLDFAYLIVGSTNTDSSLCEVTFGTGTATNCTNTRDLDPTGTTNVFANPAEDESASTGAGEANSHYAMDNESTPDATVEEATSSNVSFPVTVPTNAAVVGINYAGRFQGATVDTTADVTVQMGTKDFAGLTTATGGWTQVGSISALSYVYTDSITALAVTLPLGYIANPEDHIDTVNNRMNVRLRPTVAGTATGNATTNWDFGMVSLAWIEETAPVHPSVRYQFLPTSENLVTGSDTTITSATAAAAAGVNVGSWRGTLTDDNFHWSVLGANVVGTNYDVQLNFAGVQLNGANKMIIQTEVDLDAAIALILQICDWTSTTSVDNAADAQCTGGGWRTINSQNASNANVNLTTVTTPAGLQWHIFDGYFTTGTTGGSAVSTPLTNFVSGSNVVKIRYFSTTQSATAIDIDFLRIMPIIDSVYHPASFTNLGSGTPAGTYANAHIVGNTTTAQQATTTGDTVYLQVPGTAGSIPDFYLSFQNVETYTGANTIYFKAEYGCSAATAGLDHRFAVYNFNTPGWEDLSTTAVACSTTQATNAWAKNNVTLSNYISSGEMRVRFYGDLNSTTSLRLDYAYLMVGSTNTDSSLCEVTFGTGTATNCTNSRDLDPTGTTNVFANPAEDESASTGAGEANSHYAMDNESTPDATVEEATSSNVSFPVTVPTNAAVVGVNYAGRFIGGSDQATDLTVQMGIKDFAGLTTAVGGWTQVGGTAAFAYVYTDSITALAVTLPLGYIANPEDHIDTVNNRMNVRLRPTVAGTATGNATTNWDFVFTSIAWVYATPQYKQAAYRWFDNTDSTDVGGALGGVAQDTAATAPAQGTPFRLRLLLHNYGQDLATSGQNFKIQIASRGVDNLCDTSFSGETYSDLVATTGAIRYSDNATPADNAALTANGSDPTYQSYTVRNQSYKDLDGSDANINLTNNQSTIRSNENGKWDFAIVDFSATADTTYCMRVVKADTTTLDTYTVVPQFTTVPENGLLLAGLFPLILGFMRKLKRKRQPG